MSKGRRGFKQKGKRTYQPGTQPTYWQTEAYNQQLFNMFRNDLIELALSRFTWVGLPETCNERFLEQTLLYEGAATLAFPSQASEVLLSLKCVQQGAPNMYDEPRAWRALGVTGKTNFVCNWKNGVWIWENATRYPLMVKINIWARELADIMRTKQINRYHMRMPLLITAPQDRTFDVQNFYKNIATGEPFVLGFDNFSDIQTERFLEQTLLYEGAATLAFPSQASEVLEGAQNAIKDILLRGVTVWDDPDKIGRVSIYDNF